MVPSPSAEREGMILVHAPVGRDASLLKDLFQRAGMRSHVCLSVEELGREIERGVGAVFVAEEALGAIATQNLAAVMRRQGPWSDLPLVVLTVGGEANEASRERLRQLEPLGDVTLLERPLRSDTIVSTARTALRARAKQYEVRRRDAELQLVTDNVPVLISYIDCAQTFRRVNQTFSEWFGLRREDVVGSTIQSIIGEPHYSDAQPYWLGRWRVSASISSPRCGTKKGDIARRQRLIRAGLLSGGSGARLCGAGAGYHGA